MKKINNYRFQQQQKAKQEHHKVKKIKEKAKKTPVSAVEELDYIKKLLNGEEVEDFQPEEKIDASALHWASDKNLWINAEHQQTHMASQMSLVDYMRLMSGKGYYR